MAEKRPYYDTSFLRVCPVGILLRRGSGFADSVGDSQGLSLLVLIPAQMSKFHAGPHAVFFILNSVPMGPDNSKSVLEGGKPQDFAARGGGRKMKPSRVVTSAMGPKSTPYMHHVVL